LNKEKLVRDLIRDEGMRTDIYEDTVGKQTIGVGRNLTDRGISEAEAMFMLTNDIEIVEKELDTRMSWWKTKPADIQLALANMAFNMGVPTLLRFHKMLAAIIQDDNDTAAEQALDSKWAEQVGARARRIAELIRSA